VTRNESVRLVKEELSHLTPNLTVLKNSNVEGVQQADIILLACKPQTVSSILAGSDMREALRGKLLLSILAGVPSKQIEDILDVTTWEKPCRVIRVMPNTASALGQSMTVVEKQNPPLPEETRSLIHWMFTRIGRVNELPPHLFDASTALCGSGPAFMSLIVEAMADGGVAMGIPRKEAQLMAAQVMKGTAEMVLQGEHPALLRDKVSTPGGCTIGGLLVLEEGRVRGNIARAVREATVVAGELGKGVTGVNGTRF
jgi:pyrroline-5-carboxylate reductase